MKTIACLKNGDTPKGRPFCRRTLPVFKQTPAEREEAIQIAREIYGYIRVSTRDQNEDRQTAAMEELAIPEENVFLDTRRGKDLMGTFLSDIVLQVLSFVAENERSSIRQRQAEGIAAAKAKGVKFGRPAAPLPDNFHQVCQAWRGKEITLHQAASACAMPVGTFYAKAVRLEKSN